MTEADLSKFKMFERTSYEEPDPRRLTELHISIAKEVEKEYGAVFTARFIESALQFLAKKTGEEAPSDIETLDQLTDYLMSKVEVYPRPYCAVVYARYKVNHEAQQILKKSIF